MKKILLAGGTGFIGSHLISLLAQKYELSVLTREKRADKPQVRYFYWDIEKGVIDEKAFENVETIINLTGSNIFTKRWTKKRKAKIIDSRVGAIALLYRCILKNHFPIKTFISASATGYYGAVSVDGTFTENSEKGSDFLALVCQKWEKAAHQFSATSCRVVILRQGIVLEKDGGALQKISSFAKWRLNPVIGDGKQYFPWIDIRDLTRLYLFCIENKEVGGIHNAVSSQQITMNNLVGSLHETNDKKTVVLKIPAWLVRLLLGERASVLLEGSKISNAKIKEEGFYFLYDKLEKTLK